MNWYEYQEQVAIFFRNLGAQVETNKKIEGIRGSHDIDVYIELNLWGQKIIWISECKLWKTSIPKEKVFALYQIVQDVSADKGLLFSESGFQSGAINSTRKTNVSLVSLDGLKEIVEEELVQSLLIESLKTFANLRIRLNRLWINEEGYPETIPTLSLDRMVLLDGTIMFTTIHLQKGLNNNFPISIYRIDGQNQNANSYQELFEITSNEINSLEKEIIDAEENWKKNILLIEELKLKFLTAIEYLLIKGDEFIVEVDDENKIVKDIVHCMKNISDLATNLKAISRSNLNNHTNLIMKFLIDNTYLFLIQQPIDNHKWDTSKLQLLEIIKEFREKINY